MLNWLLKRRAKAIPSRRSPLETPVALFLIGAEKLGNGTRRIGKRRQSPQGETMASTMNGNPSCWPQTGSAKNEPGGNAIDGVRLAAQTLGTPSGLYCHFRKAASGGQAMQQYAEKISRPKQNFDRREQS